MTILLFGQLLEVVAVLILVTVFFILSSFGKIQYIENLRNAFLIYLFLIVVSIIDPLKMYSVLSNSIKYLLLAFASMFIFKIKFDNHLKGKANRFNRYLFILICVVLVISIPLNMTENLEAIGYVMFGLALAVIGILWFTSVLNHLFVSKVAGILLILLGIQMVNFDPFQQDELLYVIGYFNVTLIILLITFCFVILNFAYLKEIDQVNNSRYMNLFNNSSDAILLIKNNKIVDCNKKAEKIFDGDKDKIIGTNPLALSVDTQDNGRASLEYCQEITQKAVEGLIMRFDWVFLSLTRRKIQCKIVLYKIDTNQYAAVIIDLSDKYAYEREINFYKYYDPLTQLPKRELFIDRLTRVMEERADQVALIAFNIDNFKEVNDQYGHEIGDFILQSITSHLKSNLGNELTVTRLGGDEFVIIIDKLQNHNRVYIPIEKIQRIFDKKFEVEDNQIKISVCIGVAFSDTEEMTAMELLKNVDLALNIAKSKGRGKLEFFSQSEKEVYTNRIILEKEIRTGIENKEFIPYFQPIVEGKSGKIIGAEALARWIKKDGTIIYPNTFIPVAEETELINAMGETMIYESCRQCKKLIALYADFVVHINLSPVQLKNDQIVISLKRAMEKYDLAAKHISLEVTETVFIKNPDYTNKIIEKIRALGISVALDDFGTGYSSLSYLLEMKVDTIKIDRSFVLKLPFDKKSKLMIDYVTGLVTNLGYKMIVEGVEEKEQADYLMLKGCKYIQGYYYYRPMPYDQIEDILKKS